MSWSWGRKTGGGDQFSLEQPNSKKRKVEEEKAEDVSHAESKDVWDAGEEFTEDELEAMDLIASQAIQQSETSVQTTKPPTEISFAVPIGTAISAGNRSTSSSSDSSIYPRSLSSRTSIETTSSSISSSNGKLDPSREVVQTLQTRLDEEKKHAQEEKYHYAGEVKSLRERLHKQEGELEKLRAIRDEHHEQQQKMQTDKILKLQTQLDSLTSQVQFKNRECQSLQEKNTNLHQKVRRLEQQNQTTNVQFPLSPMPASPRKVAVQRSPLSKQKLQEMKEPTGADKAVFPTAHSFMEQTVSTTNLSTKSAAAASVSCQTTDLPYATKPPQSRRLYLNAGISNASGTITGPQVIQHLLHVNGSETTSELKEVPGKLQWNPGLFSLLHDMSTSLKITDLTYNRDKDSSFLSPLKPKRHRQGLRSLDVSSSDGTVQVVSRQNLHLAIEGLTLLLDDAKNISYRSGQDSETNLVKTLSMKIQNGTTSADSKIAVGESNSADRRCLEGTKFGLGVPKRGENFNSHQSGAVMLLPLLTDYIQHYSDLIHSKFRNVDGFFTPAQTSSTSPQSLDSFRSYAESSSFDSLSSQILQLLHEGEIYATCVEMYTVTALRCLVLLIRLCPEVGNIIISNHISLTVVRTISVCNSTTSSSSNVGTETEQSKKSSSGLEADDEHSTSSVEVQVVGEAPNSTEPVNNINNIATSTLLYFIMRLASQDLEDSRSSPELVMLAVNALTCLCQCCSQEDLPKLETLVTRGILTSCFKQTKHIPVLIWTQRLLVSLAKSDKLLSRFCTKSENCPLYLMHRACYVKVDGIFDLCKEYISTLSNIISAHRSGLSVLLSNTCPCTEELVSAVIMALYNLFSRYKTTGYQHKPVVLNTLAQGVILMHSLFQGDPAFTQHHMAVQLQYVRLLSGLASIMKSDIETWRSHLSVLDELCDFDIYDTSQDSEGEDKMDHS